MKLVVRSATHGRGVFTEELIPVGARIIRFTGPFLRYEQTSASTYALQIGPDLYIGASGGFDDLVNHSCEPNAGLRIEGTTVDLYAVRDIEAGEDTSSIIPRRWMRMTSPCAASAAPRPAAGPSGTGNTFPEDLWRKYLSLGIIPEYVQKSRAALA